MVPMAKSGKNNILLMPLNSVGVRRRTSLKLRIANGTWQTTATPLHQRQMDSGGGFIVSAKSQLEVTQLETAQTERIPEAATARL